MKIKEASSIALSILENDTQYLQGKELINDIFQYTSDNYSKGSIVSRLTIIDSYYSTQMSKRYFGLEDIADKIWSISCNEIEISNILIDFAINPQNKEIVKLFNSSYGIRKNGTPVGKAVSLLTKYAYFQTNYKFPIYDSLVMKMLPIYCNQYFQHEFLKSDFKFSNIQLFLKSINKFDRLSQINNYNQLDNLLWLSGKILDGNLSLILDKSEYIKLAKVVSVETYQKELNKIGKEVNRNFSKRILEYLRFKNTDLRKTISNQKLIKFIDYVFDLEE